MDIWDRFFKWKGEAETYPELGRFSDLYKDEKQYDAWDISLEKFEQESYHDSIQYFLRYIKDDSLQNVKWQKIEGGLRFEILQGSKLIRGFTNHRKFRAEAKIAYTHQLKIGYLRRLIDQNFGLKYSRYALDENSTITLVFDSFIIDASPYKLYYALREIALNADKQDDLLLDEFSSLDPINTGHVLPIPMKEKAIKFQYFSDEIKKVLNLLNSTRLNILQYPGAVGYLLLSTIYKLDYLITPEGNIMEQFERIHRNYFTNDQKSHHQKVSEVTKAFENLATTQADEFYKEIYKTISTFGITLPANHRQIVDLIDTEIRNMDWYLENNHMEFALAIPSYVVGYSFFNYALPEPLRDLFQLFYRITESEYFQELGYKSFLNKKLPVKKLIKEEFKRIEKQHAARFPELTLKASVLSYVNLPEFTRSYLWMIRDLNLAKIN